MVQPLAMLNDQNCKVKTVIVSVALLYFLESPDLFQRSNRFVQVLDTFGTPLLFCWRKTPASVPSVKPIRRPAFRFPTIIPARKALIVMGSRIVLSPVSFPLPVPPSFIFHYQKLIENTATCMDHMILWHSRDYLCKEMWIVIDRVKRLLWYVRTCTLYCY